MVLNFKKIGTGVLTSLSLHATQFTLYFKFFFLTSCCTVSPPPPLLPKPSRLHRQSPLSGCRRTWPSQPRTGPPPLLSLLRHLWWCSWPPPPTLLRHRSTPRRRLRPDHRRRATVCPGSATDSILALRPLPRCRLSCRQLPRRWPPSDATGGDFFNFGFSLNLCLSMNLVWFWV
jgi:hypothetical protein